MDAICCLNCSQMCKMLGKHKRSVFQSFKTLCSFLWLHLYMFIGAKTKGDFGGEWLSL